MSFNRANLLLRFNIPPNEFAIVAARDEHIIGESDCRNVAFVGVSFDRLDEKQREEVLVQLSTGKITFDSGLPTRVFWTTVYQTVIEGMFSDPIYGGNRNKAGWKLIGFPGVVAVHRENVEKYRGKKYTADILGIADMS